jgi:putative transposase
MGLEQGLTAEDVREVFETLLPTDELERLARELGVVERERKLQLDLLVRSMVIAAGTPTGGRMADAVRVYLESGGRKVARSASYRWFDEELEALMERLAQAALAYVAREKLLLPGPLAGVKDWRIVDSTTVKVRDALTKEFPGTGEYAAIKVHKTLSVGCGAPVAYHFSPAREHDTHHLTIDESWRGYGLLCDLGYASFGRLRACLQHDVRFVIRLKENWKPKVQHIARGEVRGLFFPGTDFDVLLHAGTLALNGKAIDADVTVGSGEDALQLRLVGVPSPKGYCFFLTNLPPSIGPLQVGDLYRVRWEVELSMKLDKSAHRLDEGEGERACSVKAMLHASLIASALTALLVHKHALRTTPSKPTAPRTVAPLHAHLLALQLAVSCQSISRVFELSGADAEREWQRIAELLRHQGKDPNWRSRPSVLDRLRGWKPQPVRRTKAANSQEERTK